MYYRKITIKMVLNVRLNFRQHNSGKNGHGQSERQSGSGQEDNQNGKSPKETTEKASKGYDRHFD